MLLFTAVVATLSVADAQTCGTRGGGTRSAVGGGTCNDCGTRPCAGSNGLCYSCAGDDGVCYRCEQVCRLPATLLFRSNCSGDVQTTAERTARAVLVRAPEANTSALAPVETARRASFRTTAATPSPRATGARPASTKIRRAARRATPARAARVLCQGRTRRMTALLPA